MESKCLTHLGHNLPKGGVDRYCIDLVCIAGEPLTADDVMYKSLVAAGAPIAVADQEEMNGTDQNEKGDSVGVITAGELELETYVSSAEQFSGNYNDWQRKVAIAAATVGSLLAVLFGFFCFKKKCSKKKSIDADKTGATGDGEGKMKQEEGNDDNSSGTRSNEND